MQTSEACGSIPDIIKNRSGLYEGNLVYYFRLIFYHAQNLDNPYHNFRHLYHVMWLCYSACLFYGKYFSARKMRNLLIAAMFHDFDHTGVAGPDSVNIERAVAALRKYILPEDWDHLAEIENLIQLTQFPYEIPSDKVNLPARILRDADVSQALNPAWVQHVVFGLAKEWGKKPIEVLRTQGAFHNSIEFATNWAKEMFPPEVVAAKVAEAAEYVELLA